MFRKHTNNDIVALFVFQFQINIFFCYGRIKLYMIHIFFFLQIMALGICEFFFVFAKKQFKMLKMESIIEYFNINTY